MQATDFGTVGVLEFRPTVATDPEVMAGIGDERWAGVVAETCVRDDWDGEPIKLSWGPWAVADQDGGVFPYVDATGPRYPEPVYPQLGDRTTRPGTCAKGWIVFGVTAGAKLVEVTYEGAATPEPLVWSLTQ